MTRPRLSLVPTPAPSPLAPSVDPVLRGYFVVYRGPETRCPGCGRAHWWIGRTMAECGFCATAVDLAEGWR